MYYKTNFESPVGKLTIASDETSIIGVWMEGQKYFGNTLPENAVSCDEHPVLVTCRRWLERYFAGEKPDVSELSLAPIGSEFRQNVWKLLCEIPYGEVTTYGELGRKLAGKLGKKSMSAQAVGGAVGHNPISIVIPCHRVVGADGSLTGYAGGIDKKIRLLETEQVDTAQFYVPKKRKTQLIGTKHIS